jgi:hypothetical protein
MTRAEQLTEDLESRDATRIVEAVQELERLMLALAPVPVPPPPPDLIDATGHGDRDDLIASYLTVLAVYPFDPALDAADRTWRAVDAVLKHGRSFAARQLSLHIVRASRFEGPGGVVRHVAQRGVAPGHEAEQAERLLSYLLDDADTRSETIAGLALWRSQPVLDGIVERAATWFSPDERALLDGAPGEA